jgi:zinc protease
MKLKTLRNSFFVFFIVLVLACCLEKDLLAMPPVGKTDLQNRLVILLSEDHSLPFITLELLIDGGARRDPPGKEGLAYLTAQSLLLGTSLHTVSKINEELDFMGASLSASSGRDYSTISLRVLKKDLDKALDLLKEVLTQPSFPDDEVRREKEKTLAAIQAEEDDPGEVAEKAFQKELFLSSPYGHPAKGTSESVPTISREDILRFYRTFYHPNNFILTLVGDISHDEVQKKFYPVFEKMQSVELPQSTFESSFAKGPETVKIDRDITQANIILGNAGISRENPDFYAVSVMNYILGGGGFASRLLEEIRNKRGLAYSVGSFFDAGKYPGSFQIVLQTKNTSARKAVSLALEQMDLIRKEPVSDKELEGAKKYLIGSFPLRIDTQSKLAGFLLLVQYYGLGLDYPEKYPALIQSVTKEDVLRVAKKYLHPENHILVVVANLKEAAMDDTVEHTPSPERATVTQNDLGITIIDDDSGVTVTKIRPDSPADAGGFKEGDVIVAIDRHPIKNLKDFQSSIEQWERTRNIEFSVMRGDKRIDIVVGTYLNQI